MVSCRNIPIRFRIMLLIFLGWFLITCIMENLVYVRKLMRVPKSLIRYKPWCHFSEDEKALKSKNPSFRVPWYNRTLRNYGKRYAWTQEELDYIDDSQFYGHMIFSVPGGILAEYLGPYYMLMYSVPVCALLNFTRVFFVDFDIKMLITFEFVLGVHIGLAFAAMMVWLSRWSPPNERGIFVATRIGNAIAAPFSNVFIRIMRSEFGWKGFFYNLTAFTLAYYIALFILGCNQPEDHKRISLKELHYIKSSQRGRSTTTRSFPPFGQILTCKDFWAVNILHFGYMCGDRFFTSSLGQFFYDFIGLPTSRVDYLEIVPYFGFAIMVIVTSLLADFIRTREILQNTTVAKGYAVLSHLIPGALLLFIGIARCNQVLILTILCIGNAAAGFAIVPCFRTIIDMSPNYAGTIYGLLHTSACFVMIVEPRVRNYILEINDGIVGWTIVFLIGGGCLIGTGIIFLFFGENVGHKWNLKSQDRLSLHTYKKPKGMESYERMLRETEMEEKKQSHKKGDNTRRDSLHVSAKRHFMEMEKARSVLKKPLTKAEPTSARAGGAQKARSTPKQPAASTSRQPTKPTKKNVYRVMMALQMQEKWRKRSQFDEYGKVAFEPDWARKYLDSN